MADMFGTPVGRSQAEADINNRKLTELALAEGSVRLQQAKITLQSQKLMMQQMSKLGQGKAPGGQASPDTDVEEMASTLDQLAIMAVKSGLPEKAREYASTASTIRYNASNIQGNQLKAQIQHYNLLGSLMQGVVDERSWQAANQRYQQITGRPTPYAKMRFNPQMVQQLQQGIMSAKDRALTEAAKARESATVAIEREREARIPLIKAQTELTRTRDAALKKAGATAKMPKAEDVRAITDLMVKDFGGLPSEDARVLARPVAERAVEIMKETQVTRSQAANQAYNEAKQAGHFAGIRPRIQTMGSLDRPLEIPTGKGAKDKLRVNMFYKGKGPLEGRTLLWNGTEFIPVGTGPGEIRPPSTDISDVVEEADADSDMEDDALIDAEDEEESEDDLYFDPSTRQDADFEEAQ
jgi:hypothetical protein